MRLKRHRTAWTSPHLLRPRNMALMQAASAASGTSLQMPSLSSLDPSTCCIDQESPIGVYNHPRQSELCCAALHIYQTLCSQGVT